MAKPFPNLSEHKNALTAEQIFGSTDKLAIEPVEAFGGTVLVRQLTLTEYLAYVDALPKEDLPDLAPAAVVLAHAVCDAAGQRIFPQDEATYRRLSKLPMADVLAIQRTASRLNGLGGQATEQAAKN